MLSIEARQDDIDAPRPVVARALDWPENHEENWHFHNRGQLFFASSGLMDVSTEVATYVLPPHRALWVPATVAHKVNAKSELEFRTVYIDQLAAPLLPSNPTVIFVSPLLREVILAAIDLPTLYQISGRENTIMTLLVEEVILSTAEQIDLSLPLPSDRRVESIVNSILASPTMRHSAGKWSNKVGASGRTIDRIFRAETGMSFDQWKRQAVLLEALRQLSEGKAVANVAFDLGYDSPSAFVAMFRRSLGTTPGRLFT